MNLYTYFRFYLYQLDEELVVENADSAKEMRSKNSHVIQMQEIVKDEKIEQLKELVSEKKYYERRIFEDDKLSTGFFVLSTILPATANILEEFGYVTRAGINAMTYSGTLCGILCGVLETLKNYYARKAVQLDKQEQDLVASEESVLSHIGDEETGRAQVNFNINLEEKKN